MRAGRILDDGKFALSYGVCRVVSRRVRPLETGSFRGGETIIASEWSLFSDNSITEPRYSGRSRSPSKTIQGPTLRLIWAHMGCSAYFAMRSTSWLSSFLTESRLISKNCSSMLTELVHRVNALDSAACPRHPNDRLLIPFRIEVIVPADVTINSCYGIIYDSCPDLHDPHCSHTASVLQPTPFGTVGSGSPAPELLRVSTWSA